MRKYGLEILLIVLALISIGCFLPEIIESNGRLLALVLDGIVIGINFTEIVDKKARRY